MMTLEELGKHAVEAERLMKKLTGEQKQTGLLHDKVLSSSVRR